ncbi:HTH_Tnp_Tc3_2 domain-containing protein [Trichonephila clavipes]|uniref:HTH_Tnp_Tc3_2 domain-containing protein n=1 Tax=Trichonephila clavipes TaxID=2585209 RepID=A0A8X6VQ81_TRICX|nr:HTH_Tnp_Tc3_2 domain-containing protein [Trichonephila clavipes]
MCMAVIHYRERFTEGRKRVEDDKRSGCLQTSRTAENRKGFCGSTCEPISAAVGGYSFAFHVTRISFTYSERDIALRKRSKIIILNGHTSITVRDIATVFVVGNSSVPRILRAFQDSGTSSPKRKGKCGLKRKTIPKTDKILIDNSKINPRKISKDLRRVYWIMVLK